MTCCECAPDPTPPLNPDRARGVDFGTPHNLRGRVVRAFFRLLDRLWPADVPRDFIGEIWAEKLGGSPGVHITDIEFRAFNTRGEAAYSRDRPTMPEGRNEP